MGYYTSKLHSVFCIKKENKDNALNLLKEFVSNANQIDWVDSDYVLSKHTLYDALEACRWNICEDEFGNVIDINFYGKKYGQDYEILSSIAPVVEEGSYIDMEDEEGVQWRWLFTDGRCNEMFGDVIYNFTRNTKNITEVWQICKKVLPMHEINSFCSASHSFIFEGTKEDVDKFWEGFKSPGTNEYGKYRVVYELIE